jgi:hypothetical protein
VSFPSASYLATTNGESPHTEYVTTVTRDDVGPVLDLGVVVVDVFGHGVQSPVVAGHLLVEAHEVLDDLAGPSGWWLSFWHGGLYVTGSTLSFQRASRSFLATPPVS